MSTNVTFFRGNAATPALRNGRAASSKHVHSFPRGGTAPAPVRTVLTMRWHVDPASGRLECRWVADGSATDEGVSCNELRQAA